MAIGQTFGIANAALSKDVKKGDRVALLAIKLTTCDEIIGYPLLMTIFSEKKAFIWELVLNPVITVGALVFASADPSGCAVWLDGNETTLAVGGISLACGVGSNTQLTQVPIIDNIRRSCVMDDATKTIAVVVRPYDKTKMAAGLTWEEIHN